jgi:undecaprenyl diphosphate synthase
MSPDVNPQDVYKQPLEKIPYHVGIIMDGNGRWAKKRGLPRIAGHKQGTENLRRIIKASVKFGVKMLTIYAFSTENWKRPQAEVSGLMGIVQQVIDQELDELAAEGVKLRHIGKLEGLSEDLKKKVLHAVETTRHNERLIVNVAFNYGGRMEILEAIRKMMLAGVKAEEVTEELLSQYLFTAGCPDPDLIIRTSGELRVSNFLIWQGAYSEYYVTPTFWPDFDEREYYKALLDYSQRERRYGAVDLDSRP